MLYQKHGGPARKCNDEMRKSAKPHTFIREGETRTDKGGQNARARVRQSERQGDTQRGEKAGDQGRQSEDQVERARQGTTDSDTKRQRVRQGERQSEIQGMTT